MQYKRKLIVLIMAVLTSVLLCVTLYIGCYSVAADEVKTSSAASPIRVCSKDISSGGKISLGSRRLVSGDECRVSLSWAGDGNLTVLCTSSNGTEKQYSVENGEALTFQIDTRDDYTIAVKNENIDTIDDVNGSIEFNLRG